jgi:hypothetical protein
MVTTSIETASACSIDQTHLAGIDGVGFRARVLEIVVIGIKLADEPIQLQRSLPDFKQEHTTAAAAADAAEAVGGGVVALVAAAAAVEFSRSDLQARTISTP